MVKDRVRIVGLNALKALILVDSFSSLESSKRIEIIIPALLMNLNQRENETRPGTFDELPEDSLERVAGQCFDAMISKANTACLNALMNTTFGSFEEKGWKPIGFVQSTFYILFRAVQVIKRKRFS